MPCNSSHMEQRPDEAYHQLTAVLLRDTLSNLNDIPDNALPSLAALRAGSMDIKRIAAKYYVSHDLTAALCGLLRELGTHLPITFEKLVYNARSADSRKLADWLEQHCANDAKRYEKQASYIHQKLEAQQALQLETQAIAEDKLHQLYSTLNDFDTQLRKLLK